MPPSRLSIATAFPDGAYHLQPQHYAELFSAHGLELDIQTSAGSQRNPEMLRSADHLTDLAFSQGGLGYLGAWSEPRDQYRSQVETLSNVDVEPVCLFSRHHKIDSLHQLQGLRVAIGPQENKVEQATADQPMALKGLLERLDHIDSQVVELDLPDAFSDRWYMLTEHLVAHANGC